MGRKIPISKMIEDLKEVGVYDEYTQARLDILAASAETPIEISQKERAVIGRLFSRRVKQIEQEGSIRFLPLAHSEADSSPSEIICKVEELIGFGNMGPVYAVTVDNRPYALKLYSAGKLGEMMETHGKFGLGGILHDLEKMDKRTRLTDLGRAVLDRKAKGMYGRCKRLVKIHNIGQEADCMYVLMDMLAVDPINKVNPADLGGDLVDVISWAVDCAVGLCHLHVEERRLHLNIRPEAFIKQAVKDEKRRPKYTFFHYPREFCRPAGSPCLTTEFITVDHFDNSIDISDSSPKGVGTLGSWLYMPPEVIRGLLRILRADYENYVEKRTPVEAQRTITLKRSQLDDVWALGLTFYQFISGGRSPFGEPKSLGELVKSELILDFDFACIDPLFRDLISSMLEKDRKKRLQLILKDCPEKIKSRESVAEAVLFKLENLAMECEA